ncbi:MAG: response regulator [Phenylobacterium sp.]
MANAFPDIGRSLVVLHVDDDAMNLRVVEEILTAFGHRSVRAVCGADALALLATETFDVVLMDVHMPQMTGVEAVQRLRASDSPGAKVPVIALTADVVSRRPDEYRALGFTDFVAKPILVSGLLDAIKRAVTPKSAEAAPIRRVG